MNMTQGIRASVLTGALSVLSAQALAGGEKFADVRGPLPAVTVRFNDLNTSTADGIRVLYARVGMAAYAVCHTTGDWYPAAAWANDDCYRATLDRVVAKLNLPRLTALHLQSTKREPGRAALQADSR